MWFFLLQDFRFGSSAMVPPNCSFSTDLWWIVFLCGSMIWTPPLEFPLQNGDPGAHHSLENSFHIFSKLDYLHSLETYLYNFDLVWWKLEVPFFRDFVYHPRWPEKCDFPFFRHQLYLEKKQIPFFRAYLFHDVIKVLHSLEITGSLTSP